MVEGRPETLSELKEEQQRAAWVEIDLAAVRSNLAAVRSRTACPVLCLVKGNAYGHGAVEVARTLEEEGADWLGVAFLEEAVPLRAAGLRSPILVLAPIRPSQLDLADRLAVTPTVSSLEQVAMWCERGAARPRDVHLKVNTGMNRLGIQRHELDEALRRLRAASGVRLGGLMTHYSASEDLEGCASERQDELFTRLLQALEAEEREGCLLHQANSAATLHRPASHHDLVRVGGALYGVDLVDFVEPGSGVELRPVMSVAARVVQVREIEAGEGVGYGSRWVARRKSRIGVLPLGYADGYSTRMSRRGEVLVEGRRVPVAGAVSMDLSTVDLTDTEADVGTQAILLGDQGAESISVHEVAHRAEIAPYEVLCRFGLRLPRRYRRGPAGGG